jgi:hypothetical protein
VSRTRHTFLLLLLGVSLAAVDDRETAFVGYSEKSTEPCIDKNDNCDGWMNSGECIKYVPRTGSAHSPPDAVVSFVRVA